MNRPLIGWIVAAVLAAVLGGVLIYQAVDDDGGSRPAALGSESEAGLPENIASDVDQIMEEKETEGENELPEVREGEEAPRLDENPQGTCDPDLSPNVFPEWRNDPENLDQALEMSDQIVVGTTSEVTNGQPFTARAQGEPGGQTETPILNVTLDVDQSIKGPAREGGTITIQSLGDAAGCYRAAGDPRYQQGQKYLLMLENGEGGRPPHVISPAGRYMVGDNNVLEAVENTAVSEDVAGQKLGEVVEKLQGS
jgi:hypothetical protein